MGKWKKQIESKEIRNLKLGTKEQLISPTGMPLA